MAPQHDHDPPPTDPRHQPSGPLAADRSADVAVVGGGLAGLAAAAMAARAGAEVVLLEGRTRFGGRAETVRREGFALNLGPHALYIRGAASRLAAELGVAVRGQRPALGDARARVGDRLERLPMGARALATTGVVPPRARPQLARVLAAVSSGRARPAATTSVRDWLDELSDRDDVRAVVGALVRLTTYANAEELLSAAAAAAQIELAGGGVLYLDGGWQALVDGFAAAAVAAGASCHDTSAVVAMAPAEGPGGGWLLETDQHAVRAAAAVLAVPPGVAVRLLGAQPAGWDRLGPPVTAAVLDLGLDEPPPVRFCLGIDRPLYLSTHTPPADLAPAGMALVTAARYHRPDDPAEPAAVGAELTEHAERSGIAADGPGLRRYLHRVTVAQAMPLAAEGGLAARPSITVDGWPGVFVAGDWIGPHGMLGDAAAASGAAAGTAAARSAAARRVPPSGSAVPAGGRTLSAR